MINTDIMEINEEDLSRMESLVDLARKVFEEHKYLLTNKNINIRFELANDPSPWVISGISNYFGILIRVSCVILTANWQIDVMLKDIDPEYADDMDLIRSLEDRVYTIQMVFTVLHEMVHQAQQSPTYYDLNGLSITNEDSADWLAVQILREEYNLQEYEAALLFESSYGRRFLIYSPPTPDNLFDYYNESLKIVVCMITNNISRINIEVPSNLLYIGIDIMLVNNINNRDIKIPIRLNGVLMRPSAEYAMLLRLIVLGTQESWYLGMRCIISDDETLYTIIIDGTVLIQPFTEDIGKMYGIRPVDIESLKNGKLTFKEDKES